MLTSLFSLTWQGAFSLPKHAWLIGVFGGFVLAKASLFIVMLSGIKLLLVPMACLVAAYYFVAGVGLWRAAVRYVGPKIWAYASRVLALFLALGFPVAFVASVLK